MHIRPLCLETDLAAVAAVINACEPGYPDTQENIRAWILKEGKGRISQFLVAADTPDAVAGFGCLIHSVGSPEHDFYTWLGVDPARRGQGVGALLWQALCDALLEQGATSLYSEVVDCDPLGLAFAQRRGFRIENHRFRSSLDLSTFDETPYLPLIAGLEAQGMRFCALSDFPATPEVDDQFMALNLAAVRDIPGETWDFANYPQFFRDSILGSPRFRRDAHLLAVDGEQWVGFASVSLTPGTQSAYNSTTGVIRAYRGRKVATALKVLATRFARQHGAQVINTDNDSLNAPMLAVNRKLSYQPSAGKYTLVAAFPAK